MNTIIDIATLVQSLNEAKAKHAPHRALVDQLESLPPRTKGKKELVANAKAVADESRHIIDEIDNQIRTIAIKNLRVKIAEQFCERNKIADASSDFILRAMTHAGNFHPSQEITVGEYRFTIKYTPEYIYYMNSKHVEIASLTAFSREEDSPMSWSFRLCNFGNVTSEEITEIMVIMQDAQRLMNELNNAKLKQIGWNDITTEKTRIIEANTIA